MKNPTLVRSAALVSVFGLALAAGGGIALTAAPVAFAQNSAVIDESAPVTLTINKILNPDAIGSAGTGEVDPSVSGTPLPGVTFTATLLNTDGVANADLGSITASDLQNATRTGTTVQGVTGASGQLVFDSRHSNLEQGIWIVEESITAPITVGDVTYEPGEIASTSFVVALPYTTPTSDGWNYDVVVYPKNAAPQITKTVNDAEQNVGDRISYTVKATVPAVPSGESLTRFAITDQTDAENLHDVTVDSVMLSDGTPIDTSNYDATVGENGLVTIEFNAAGRAFLANHAGKTVDVTIGGEVLAVAGTDGVATNEATLIVHYPGQENKTEKDSNEVTSYWGQVQINKTEAGSAGTVLEGAQFELFRCEGNETSADQFDGIDPISINGNSTWTTNAEGTVTIDGIHVTDIENDTVDIDRWYCLVEIEAPNGYVATEEVHRFQLASDSEERTAGGAPLHIADIENQRSEVPQLPLTGGMGIGILAALGVIIAGLAAWVARRNGSEA
ncbi:hypothetical protein CSTAT_11895 [Corynebacterium stationis]|uniref:SpaH/EbpB family LPXTG-anchored major pilin n=1 Tax=Corynebacterium stationis TaxID=1705 RepID=UPI000950B40F|nr:SpaH/EbpB family LPXTG-anchored major pilin [Corynebacterium stationis]APT95937.1 hypothetical protein CSTAT_11895 [Corynebacterium stationis]